MWLPLAALLLLAPTSALAQDDTDTAGWGGNDTDTGDEPEDTDCRRSDTADSDLDDCDDATADTDVDDVTSGTTYTAGQLLGEEGGSACASAGSRSGLGVATVVLVGAARRSRRRDGLTG
jgi:hypothetical protein